MEHSEEFVEQLVASAMAANSSPGWPEAVGGPAVFGFFGIAAAAAGIAKILFFIFIILFLISLVGGLMHRT